MKLTDKQWLEIQTKYELGEGIRSIAREYDIPHGTIQARIKKEGWTQELARNVFVIQDNIKQISQVAKKGQLPLIQAKLTETVDLMKEFNSFVSLAAKMNVHLLDELSRETDLKTKISGIAALKATFKDLAEITKAPPVQAGDENTDSVVKIEFVHANK